MGFIGWRGGTGGDAHGTESGKAASPAGEKNAIPLSRAGSLTAAVEEMRKDADRIFDDLLEVAGEPDETMGVRRS
ncbi:hypothetical protein E2N92_04200 [Methanofollis formosanus]|uniref:Uncharacterized protein n=1 Tax=Methanofollis formosanus TaxID=299308 RepID=A0A8G1A0Z8_9EURY|nr:hypothetical protein [Methanofollis formosanus]QYZ78683.1 hypothetical protein E2N92_04200 [Methanofollis formosanus]